jgi:hypothetical protein
LFKPGATITSLTPKGVNVLFCTNPIHHLIVVFLLSHIFCDGRFVQPHRTDVIAPRPKVPVAKLVFHIRMPVKDHQGALAFQIAHKTRHADLDQQVDMIDLGAPLDNLASFPLAEIPQNLYDTALYWLYMIFRRYFGVKMR